MQRTGEMLSGLCGCEIAEGTLAEWVELAAETLSPTLEQIAQGVLASPLQHADEMGVHLGGKLHWMHVNSTRFRDAPGLAWEAGMRSARDHRYLAAVLATEHIRSKKGAHVGSTGSFSLLSTHRIDDVRVSHMKFPLS